MGLVALMQKATNRERVEDWTRARSASEGHKGRDLHVLAGVAPYRAADRADQFQHKVNQMLEDVDDLTPCTIGLAPEKRDIPAVTDLPTYISARVQQQVDGSSATHFSYCRC